MNLREALSELAHSQWAGWWTWQVSKSKMNEDGSMTIPAWAVERWNRQAGTSYADLSEQEQRSDQIEADKALEIIREWIREGLESEE